MILRLNGGQHIQVIQQYDKPSKKTKYRARKSDSQGRAQSEFGPWCNNFDDAVEKAKEMEVTKRGRLNNST